MQIRLRGSSAQEELLEMIRRVFWCNTNSSKYSYYNPQGSPEQHVFYDYQVSFKVAEVH